MADTERAVQDRPDQDRPDQDRPDQDRDQVDFSGLTRRLRRWGLLRPPGPPAPEQLGLFTAPETTPSPESLRAPTAEDPSGPGTAGTTPIVRDEQARYLLVGAIVGYIWLFGYWTMRNHDGLGTQAFDFGIYDQGLWLLSHFQSPFITVMGRQLFGDHTSFILLPLVPFAWLFPTAKVLLASQAAALGVAALPAYLLAREKLRSEMLAALLAVTLLLQPVLGWTNLEHFHPDVFEVPLVMFALYFMVKERWIPYFVCLVLALLVKEDVVLLGMGLGAYVAVKHDRRIGLITCGVSFLYAATAVWWILPALNGVGTLNAWRIPFGGPGGFIRAVIVHPGQVITYLLVHDRLWYLWQLLAPLGLVALFAPSVLLIGFGPLASNLVSNFPYQYDIHYHYSTLILPVLLAATVFGVAKRRSHADRKKIVVGILAATLVTAYLWGPTPLGRHEAAVADPGSALAANFHLAVRLLPSDASVSTFYQWLPQIDHRKEVYMFPNPWKASYWGTFKQEGQRLPIADDVQYLLLPTQLDPEPKAVLDSIRGDFDVLYEQGGVLLLHRRA